MKALIFDSNFESKVFDFLKNNSQLKKWDLIFKNSSEECENYLEKNNHEQNQIYIQLEQLFQQLQDEHLEQKSTPLITHQHQQEKIVTNKNYYHSECIELNQNKTFKTNFRSYQKNEIYILIIVFEGNTQKREIKHFINWVRKNLPKWIFICIFSKNANENILERQKYFESYKINMLTHDLPSLIQLFSQIEDTFEEIGEYNCPNCQLKFLNENGLWKHQPLYHVNEPNDPRPICPICYYENTKQIIQHQNQHSHDEQIMMSDSSSSSSSGSSSSGGHHLQHLQLHHQISNHHYLKEPFPVHLRNSHGLVKQGIIKEEERGGLETYSFAMILCRYSSTSPLWLVVQEFASSGFWFPAGKVDKSETFAEAAIRETKEEAGIDIQLKGIVSIHRTTNKKYCRESIIFYAEPIDKQQIPKSIPDYESVGACWATTEQLSHVPLRSKEVYTWFKKVESGAPIYPLDILHDKRR